VSSLGTFQYNRQQYNAEAAMATDFFTRPRVFRWRQLSRAPRTGARVTVSARPARVDG
jgi:hypothetical protein